MTNPSLNYEIAALDAVKVAGGLDGFIREVHAEARAALLEAQADAARLVQRASSLYAAIVREIGNVSDADVGRYGRVDGGGCGG